jgi:hypothetical protein
MKINQQYIITESCAGKDCSYSQGEVVTLTLQNIVWCESLINAGIMVEVETIEGGTDETGKTELVVVKKNQDETLEQE